MTTIQPDVDIFINGNKTLSSALSVLSGFVVYFSLNTAPLAALTHTHRDKQGCFIQHANLVYRCHVPLNTLQ